MKLFGTDGIRGIFGKYPVNKKVAFAIGLACSKYFEKNSKIIIGKDTRKSGEILEEALIRGLKSGGIKILNAGIISTPALAFLTKEHNCSAGLIITASHNPSEYNGIKFFLDNGLKFTEKEEIELEKIIISILEKEEIEEENFETIKISENSELIEKYIEHSMHSIENYSLKGKKIVLDSANGAAYKISETIFSKLGAELICIGNKPNGYNTNKQCGALYPKNIQKKVIETNSDIGISLDGDADRIVICDEKGKILDGDNILAILAVYLKEKGKLKNNSVVGTVMSNLGFRKLMNENKINFIETNVGDKYVINEMEKNNYSLGGEQAGHIIVREYVSTGDGIICALQLLKVLIEKNKKLSELSNIMEHFPQVLVNVKIKEKISFENMPNVNKQIEKSKFNLGEKGRILVRYSGTSNLARIMVEGVNKKKVSEQAYLISEEIRKKIGVLTRD